MRDEEWISPTFCKRTASITVNIMQLEIIKTSEFYGYMSPTNGFQIMDVHANVYVLFRKFI